MYTNYNGINYFIPKLENETLQMYNIRKWIICKNEPKNEDDLKKISKIAKLYINRKILGCSYSNTINNMINEYISEELS